MFVLKSPKFSFLMNLAGHEATGPEDLASALVASGLVKNSDIFKPKEPPPEDKPKKIPLNRLSLPNTIHIRKPNLLRPSVLEDIVIDRQVNPTMNTRLPMDASLRVQATMRNPENPSDISFLYENVQRSNFNNNPSFSNKDILNTFGPSEEITFPKTILACQTLGKPMIASRANYDNLNNLLKEMTEPINQDHEMTKVEKIIHQKEAYDTVLSEIVRQGYFECSQKGDLFQNVRTFVSDVSEQLPDLMIELDKTKKHSEKMINNLSEQIDTLNQINNDLAAQNEASNQAQKSLESRIHMLTLKIPDIENEARKLRAELLDSNEKATNLEKELSEAQSKIQTLKQMVDAKNEIAASLGNELNELNDKLHEANTRNIGLMNENSEMKELIFNLQEAIKKLEEDLKEKEKEIVVKEFSDATTQTRQLLKERAKAKKTSNENKIMDLYSPNPDINPNGNMNINMNMNAGLNQMNNGNAVININSTPINITVSSNMPTFQHGNNNSTFQIDHSNIYSSNEQPQNSINQPSNETLNDSNTQENTSNEQSPESVKNNFVETESPFQTNPANYGKNINHHNEPIINHGNNTSNNFNNNKIENKTNNRNDQESSMSVADIKATKNDYTTYVEKFGQPNLNLGQFMNIREFILNNNDKFAGTTDQVIESQKGVFELDKSPHEDELKLFSHFIMSRVMDKALLCSSKTEKSVQTFAETKQLLEKSTNVTASEIYSPYSDAFTKLLNPVYANRPPRPFEWILKATRSIFDEKTLLDATDKAPINMPQFSLTWSTRQFGLDYLAHQCAWDLINSARAHQNKSIEIEMFRKFIDEEFSLDQLTFFLRVRAALLKRGFSLSVNAIESTETYTTIYLTGSEGISIIQKIFAKAGQDTVNRITSKLREKFVRKPSSTVDQNVSYIQMFAILEIANEEFAKHEHHNIMMFLNSYNISPPISGKLFSRMIRKIIPNSTEEEIAVYFRISNVENSKKIDIKRRKLQKLMIASSLLSKDNCEELLSLKQYKVTPEYEMAKGRWSEMEPIFSGALEKYNLRGEAHNPTVTHIARLLRTEIDAVGSAFACFDVVGAQRHMLSCIMNYQAMIWTMNEPNPNEIDSITQSIKSILNL
ncbi:hypothetical protein TRFO_26458 [Tritrichomonas foetus]|uniref:Uncharacterized protein n=1 Tax=Tritrichomonas foetus TaxID=1144522 RepID=A0A1J4K7T2_9EUKA|nr:hypothetical protein TRFO_26458 [Tritrichomonas foetus]|eukprot:OHT05772.1 hypothetical protein TRFO_26458 [Tritrichomonas foetus]